MPKLILRPRYTLKYSEMAWWLIDNEGTPLMNKSMLGNARGIQAYRDGDKVLITSETIGCGDKIIPSDTIVKGFALSQDGKSLYELMDSGVVCNCKLRPIRSL